MAVENEETPKQEAQPTGSRDAPASVQGGEARRPQEACQQACVSQEGATVKVGDLVMYCGENQESHLDWVGLVMNVNNGTARYALVKWNRRGITSNHPAHVLRVINASG